MKEDNWNLTEAQVDDSTRQHTEALINELELAQRPEPSSIDAYIAGEVRHARKEIEQFHLATLERFRDEIKANLEMRKRWAADSAAQLECINDVIERIEATRLKEGDSHVDRNDSTRAAGDSDVPF